VNSLFTLGLLIGITVLETTHGTTIANLGFQQVTFPTPVFAGDTIHAETEVTAARASGSRPNAGIVTFEHRAFNQRDQLVCQATRDALMHRRPHETA
jgi:acyl dehydratase